MTDLTNAATATPADGELALQGLSDQASSDQALSGEESSDQDLLDQAANSRAIAATERIASIDTFRGLTILIMLFVNDLGREGIPTWMQHMPADADAMTFVDMVFPAFLFIVGMSIPLSVEQRERKGTSRLRLWSHTLLRTLGLLTMGVYMVNQETFNSEAATLGYFSWSLIMYAAILLLWNADPKFTRQPALFIGMKLFGVGLLGWLFVSYRGGDSAHGMETSWWGILGLIGWSYLICFSLYEVLGRNLTALVAAIPVLVCLSLGVRTEAFDPPYLLDWLKNQAGHSVHATLTLCGLVVSLSLFGKSKVHDHQSRLTWLGTMAVLLFVAGYCLRPLHGVSKIYATPTWGLYSASICCLVFAALYWVMDVKKRTRWANFLTPAGENPLLVYILPGIAFSLLGLSNITLLDDYAGSGGARIARAAILAVALVQLGGFLGKRRVRLRL